MCTRADEDLLRVEKPKPASQRIYHLGNNIAILELMKTYYDLKHLSHLDNVFIT